jgi:hypothetical protein
VKAIDVLAMWSVDELFLLAWLLRLFFAGGSSAAVSSN